MDDKSKIDTDEWPESGKRRYLVDSDETKRFIPYFEQENRDAIYDSVNEEIEHNYLMHPARVIEHWANEASACGLGFSPFTYYNQDKRDGAIQ